MIHEEEDYSPLEERISESLKDIFTFKINKRKLESLQR